MRDANAFVFGPQIHKHKRAHKTNSYERNVFRMRLNCIPSDLLESIRGSCSEECKWKPNESTCLRVRQADSRPIAIGCKRVREREREFVLVVSAVEQTIAVLVCVCLDLLQQLANANGSTQMRQNIQTHMALERCFAWTQRWAEQHNTAFIARLLVSFAVCSARKSLGARRLDSL